MNTDHKVDRTGWPAGPWDNEADRYEWRDAATGLPCLIVRNRSGALCGYVGVSPDHPWHGIDYAGCALSEPCAEGRYCEHSVSAPVHGGLTYSDKCDASPICHTLAPGESDDVWWFGFDCAHAGDLAPGLEKYGITGGTYRDRAYVEEQCAALAQQLALVGQTTEGV